MEAPAQSDPIDAAFTAALPAEPEAAPAEPASPTAKQMAEAEEINAARLRKLAEQNARMAEPKEEPPALIGLAAQGMDVLHDAIRAHSNQPTHPDYVPPPRTARQMTALQEELEAGRRASQRAKEQQQVAAEWRAKQSASERAAEGSTTPVHRPGLMVPNPAGGHGTFKGA